MPSSSAGGKIKQIATIETPPNSATLPIQIPTVTCDLASDISTSEAADIEPHPIMLHNGNSGLLATNTATASTLQPQQHQQLQISSSMPNPGGDVLKVSTITTARGTLTVPTPPSIAADIDESLTPNATTPLTTSNELRVSPVVNRGRALSVGIDTDMVSEFDPSSSDSGVVSRCAVVKPLKFRLCQPIFGRTAQQQRQNEEKATAAAAAAAAAALQQMNKQTQQQQQEQQLQQKQVVESELLAKQAERDAAAVIAKVQKPRDPEKEKRRIARKKEKRATLILGLIMGSFIACWLPFFFLYILMPACRSHCSIPDSAFAVAFWLGYMNSALNPAIYTIFNKDFRRAFRRILFK